MVVKYYREGEFGEFYELSPLTLCPIDKTPIIPELLGDDAREYLNSYHAMVYEKLSPYLEGEDLEYLKESCSEL
jgi:Xaa-Pro aminopeptidase